MNEAEVRAWAERGRAAQAAVNAIVADAERQAAKVRTEVETADHAGPGQGVSVGKRSSTAEPLTEHDVAERLDRAALRVWRIMDDARAMGIMADVKSSRYMRGSLAALAAELVEWGVTPQPFREATPGPSRL